MWLQKEDWNPSNPQTTCLLFGIRVYICNYREWCGVGSCHYQEYTKETLNEKMNANLIHTTLDDALTLLTSSKFPLRWHYGIVAVWQTPKTQDWKKYIKSISLKKPHCQTAKPAILPTPKNYNNHYLYIFNNIII